jgi:hypothetical protein
LIAFLASALTACFASVWQLLTRFHTVKITPDYIRIGNGRYYYVNITVGPLNEMLVKHKLSLITVHEEYQYSFSIIIRQLPGKPVKFHFESKYYAGFDELYNALRKKVRAL